MSKYLSWAIVLGLGAWCGWTGELLLLFTAIGLAVVALPIYFVIDTPLKWFAYALFKNSRQRGNSLKATMLFLLVLLYDGGLFIFWPFGVFCALTALSSHVALPLVLSWLAVLEPLRHLWSFGVQEWEFAASLALTMCAIVSSAVVTSLHLIGATWGQTALVLVALVLLQAIVRALPVLPIQRETE